MKKCVYCSQDIDDTARKCHYCHSFQSTADDKKKNLDIASLVIGFVGVVASIGTIAAGVFAYFGYQSISAINERSDKNIERANTILTKVEQEISDFHEQAKKLSLAEGDVEKVKINLAALSVREAFSRFQQIMEEIVLDQLHRTGEQLDALQEIADSVSAIKDEQLPDEDIRSLKRELVLTVDAVYLYRGEKYQQVLDKLNALSDKSIQKHRLMGDACYRLYLKALKEQKTDDAAGYLGQELHHAQLNYELALKVNRSLTISEINYSNALLLMSDNANLDHAYQLLLIAKKDSPQMSIIYYNLAIYHAKKGQLEEAMTQLEWAKQYGDFMSPEDVLFFNADPAFEKLRSSQEQLLKDRIQALLIMPHG
jgi:hypothetical protein